MSSVNSRLFEEKLQLQDRFQDQPLSSLSRLGLGLYELLPDYRDCCPLCRGSRCAVRHGLYFRRLVDVDGRIYERFPVARFRCRRRGPDQPGDVTFSVLPAQVAPRRCFSRYLTLARFYTRENFAVVVSALQKAFARHGLPQILYCDNGSAFSSKQLTLACARLGVALVHSKPYDAPSRGKIERWFRTLRQGFLSTLDAGSLTLEDLNTRLAHWLEQDYHRRRHSGIAETPLARYLRSLASIRRRTVSRAELDRVFYRTLHRTVRNDCTVSIRRQLWEVPPLYMGRRIEIRHPEGRPTELFLFEDDQPVVRLHRVDAAQNATSPRRPRFSLSDQEDES